MPKITLAQISSDKRDRVMLEAARLFAERGFTRADMAELARRAAVAKGSLYNYFESKEDCYIFVCRDGLTRHREALYGGLDPDWDIYRQIEHFFRSGMVFANEHPEFIILYLNTSSAGMDRFADALSREVEEYFARHLKALLTRAAGKGILKQDLDIGFTAHMINSIYIMFLSALVSRHHQIRLQEYLDLEIGSSDDATISLLERTIDFLNNFLAPNSGAPRE